MPKAIFLPLTDSQRYAFKCTEGHKNVFVISQTRFEILAEVGLQAIVDGYYRDAVSSFSASLERLYEFYLRVVCLHKDIDNTEIEKSWKNIQHQSERQLGMFVGLYLSENGSTAPILDPNSATKLRNQVVHKGLIPTKDNAISFAQAVANVVQPILKNMNEKYPIAVRQCIGHQRFIARAQDPHAVYWNKNMVYQFGETVSQTPPNIREEVLNRLKNPSWNRAPWVTETEPLVE